MYERRGVIRAKTGRRDALLAILREVSDDPSAMAGCLAYEVAPVADDQDAIAVFERWADEASHRASLDLDAVRATIARARPLIESVS